eukprot:10689119-Alexandrium_andersonii.AAC.1
MAPPPPALSDLIPPPSEPEQPTARPNTRGEPCLDLEPLAAALLGDTATPRSCKQNCGGDTPSRKLPAQLNTVHL